MVFLNGPEFVGWFKTFCSNQEVLSVPPIVVRLVPGDLKVIHPDGFPDVEKSAACFLKQFSKSGLGVGFTGINATAGSDPP